MKKIKIVIDTNIFVSAFLGSKNARLVLNPYKLMLINKPVGLL
ncbi:hypothetical protein [Clostridium sp. Cult1]|jgi:predicted nucleic acid-binding protein|nr:hypothetical protein [Clostridium sp. Cult1]